MTLIYKWRNKHHKASPARQIMGCDFDRGGLVYVSIKNGLLRLVRGGEVQNGPVTAGGPPLAQLFLLLHKPQFPGPLTSPSCACKS